MIQFWRKIECHVLCVMVFMIACKYLRLRILMYKALCSAQDRQTQGLTVSGTVFTQCETIPLAGAKVNIFIFWKLLGFSIG